MVWYFGLEYPYYTTNCLKNIGYQTRIARCAVRSHSTKYPIRTCFVFFSVLLKQIVQISDTIRWGINRAVGAASEFQIHSKLTTTLGWAGQDAAA